VGGSLGGEKLGSEEWKGERGKVNGMRGEGQQSSIRYTVWKLMKTPVYVVCVLSQ